ncbi:hypothetical protein AGMMS49965_20380 [Bacteroidia bacterium]|nr:hypothetical protein AGMMS49965_20380 [Bacteroidia bacterium]
MKIRRKDLIDDFTIKYPDATSALQRWIDIVKAAKWASHADIKMNFSSADYVGNGRYVFNIKGNNYRLVVLVVFVEGLVTVRFVGTHREYDNIDCKTI